MEMHRALKQPSLVSLSTSDACSYQDIFPHGPQLGHHLCLCTILHTNYLHTQFSMHICAQKWSNFQAQCKLPLNFCSVCTALTCTKKPTCKLVQHTSLNLPAKLTACAKLFVWVEAMIWKIGFFNVYSPVSQAEAIIPEKVRNKLLQHYCFCS